MGLSKQNPSKAPPREGGGGDRDRLGGRSACYVSFPPPIHSLCPSFFRQLLEKRKIQSRTLFPSNVPPLYDQAANHVVTLDCMWMVLFGQSSQNIKISQCEISVCAFECTVCVCMFTLVGVGLPV